MSDPGFASLGPSLLARKGGAKPAMRRQVAPLAESHADIADDQLEDLGWNDMGDTETSGSADIVPINAGMDADGFGGDAGPTVRRQQRSLAERLLADAVMSGPEDREPEYDDEDEALYGDEYAEGEEAEGHEADGYDVEDEDEGYEPAYLQPEPVALRPAAKPRSPAVQSGRRAAFTLRLDADRHLKLRLAATMQGISAQVLVTEALDRLLAEFDELDVIATHLKRH
jgi:predicted HicB family RNase H-like nuclease